jgi:sugar phosphate isomerase/epimerase
MADYHISDIYQGGASSLDSGYGPVFTGYRTSVSKLGLSTDPRTANILKEVSEKIAPGEKVIELSLIQPENFEAIPKQHLKEIQRLSKLTGVEITVHGPLIDASGVSQQGFNEQQREIAERKILQAIERSHEINPNGNIPVTFHTANQLPGARYSKDEQGKEFKEFMPVVNQITGEITGARTQEGYFPGDKDSKDKWIEKKQYSVEKQLDIMNRNEWENSLQQLITPKEHADRILRETYPLVMDIHSRIKSGEIKLEDLTFPQQQAFSRFENAQEQLKDVNEHLNSLFSKAYKAYDAKKDERGINYLKEVAQNFHETVGEEKSVMGFSTALNGFMKNLRVLSEPHFPIGAPQVYVPAEEYAIEKSVETFGNAAWSSYKKFGEKAPIINIENPPAGFGLSRAEDLKKLVEGSRKKFVENAVKNGISENNAKLEAEKLIGVTWDVGHINQLRQFGFSGKDIIKEAEKIAPLVKHVHLSDNFGYENVELPMGMGNVDLKEVMQKLGKNGEEARKIVEAAHWWQFQQTNPIGVSMEALGSPIYSMNMAPYWNQAAGVNPGYFGGYGTFLPQINYETFGGGFSQLPTELGGQRQGGGRSRMGGTPME